MYWPTLNRIIYSLLVCSITFTKTFDLHSVLLFLSSSHFFQNLAFHFMFFRLADISEPPICFLCTPTALGDPSRGLRGANLSIYQAFLAGVYLCWTPSFPILRPVDLSGMEFLPPSRTTPRLLRSDFLEECYFFSFFYVFPSSVRYIMILVWIVNLCGNTFC